MPTTATISLDEFTLPSHWVSGKCIFVEDVTPSITYLDVDQDEPLSMPNRAQRRENKNAKKSPYYVQFNKRKY